MKAGDVIGYENTLGMRRFGRVLWVDVEANIARVHWDAWPEYLAFLEDKERKLTEHDREYCAANVGYIEIERDRSYKVGDEIKTAKLGVVDPIHHNRIKWVSPELRNGGRQ